MSQSPRPKPNPSREKPSVSLRARALRLLARREHTRLELKRKLAAHAVEAGELDPELIVTPGIYVNRVVVVATRGG